MASKSIDPSIYWVVFSFAFYFRSLWNASQVVYFWKGLRFQQPDDVRPSKGGRDL